MRMAFEMKTFCVRNGVISKSHGSQVVPKCEFLKWGYHYSSQHPACTVEHFVNIFTAKGIWHVCQFRDAKRVVISFNVSKKINKMEVAD